MHAFASDIRYDLFGLRYIGFREPEHARPRRLRPFQCGNKAEAGSTWCRCHGGAGLPVQQCWADIVDC